MKIKIYFPSLIVLVTLKIHGNTSVLTLAVELLNWRKGEMCKAKWITVDMDAFYLTSCNRKIPCNLYVVQWEFVCLFGECVLLCGMLWCVCVPGNNTDKHWTVSIHRMWNWMRVFEWGKSLLFTIYSLTWMNDSVFHSEMKCFFALDNFGN